MLYKNVDICDLKSIFENGILPLDDCGNDNWDDGRRANNSTNVVYLFSPKLKNCLHMYGLALLEINANIGERKVEFAQNDNNSIFYDEYVVNKVKPDDIVSVYLPVLLKNRIMKILKSYNLSDEIYKKIKWVQMKAYRYSSENTDKICSVHYYKGEPQYTYCKECSENEYDLMFSDSFEISANNFNYFRGFKENKLMCDYELIEYNI